MMLSFIGLMDPDTSRCLDWTPPPFSLAPRYLTYISPYRGFEPNKISSFGPQQGYDVSGEE